MNSFFISLLASLRNTWSKSKGHSSWSSKSFLSFWSSRSYLSYQSSSPVKPKRVYLDNAGATEVGRSARSALVEMLSLYGNPSGIHHEGTIAGQMLDRARALCASVLNAHAYEVYFVSSGTESCNLAVLGTYEGFLHNQKHTVERHTTDTLPHIIVSSIEHPSVLEPVKLLERKGSVRVTYLPVYEEGIVKVKDVREPSFFFVFFK